MERLTEIEAALMTALRRDGWLGAPPGCTPNIPANTFTLQCAQHLRMFAQSQITASEALCAAVQKAGSVADDEVVSTLKLEAVRLLIQLGADVNCNPKLYHDIHDPVAEYWSPLARACYCGNVAAVRELIAAGACIDAGPDPEVGTALWRAAEAGEVECMEILLSRGAKRTHKLYDAFSGPDSDLFESEDEIVLARGMELLRPAL